MKTTTTTTINSRPVTLEAYKIWFRMISLTIRIDSLFLVNNNSK